MIDISFTIGDKENPNMILESKANKKSPNYTHLIGYST